MRARDDKTSAPTRLVVNADDMGIDSQISAGILSAYRNGIVSSTSLIVTMPNREDAISTVVKPNDIPVGLHLSLTEGHAVSSAAVIPELVSVTGLFRISAARLMTLRPSQRTKPLFDQIRTEVTAQFALAKDYGLTLTHVDSHQHIHMNPTIFQIVEDIAPRFGVHRIRFSREPPSSLLLTGEVMQSLKHLTHVKWALLRWLAHRIKPKLQTTDQFFGLLHSGAVSKHVLLPFLQRTHQGMSVELCVHPGFAPVETIGSKADATSVMPFQKSAYRQIEHDALIDSEVADVVRGRGLRLTSHTKIAKA